MVQMHENLITSERREEVRLFNMDASSFGEDLGELLQDHQGLVTVVLGYEVTNGRAKKKSWNDVVTLYKGDPKLFPTDKEVALFRRSLQNPRPPSLFVFEESTVLREKPAGN